jgi:hypothetical protein
MLAMAWSRRLGAGSAARRPGWCRSPAVKPGSRLARAGAVAAVWGLGAGGTDGGDAAAGVYRADLVAVPAAARAACRVQVAVRSVNAGRRHQVSAVLRVGAAGMVAAAPAAKAGQGGAAVTVAGEMVLAAVPGGTGSDAPTQVAWGEPVYNPNSGDPCYSAGQGQASECHMGGGGTWTSLSTPTSG